MKTQETRNVPVYSVPPWAFGTGKRAEESRRFLRDQYDDRWPLPVRIVIRALLLGGSAYILYALIRWAPW